MRIVRLDEKNRQNIMTELIKRDPNQYTEYAGTVAGILDRVKAEGDAAIFEYTKKFDGFDLDRDNIRITKEEIDAAYSELDDKLIGTMKRSMENIRAFHENQLQKSWFTYSEDGSILGQKITPIDSVGVYVPGGKAAYPSTVLMNIIPARVAGVKRIVMTTPCGRDGKVAPATLVAADLAGATEMYKVGGAQAIGALAFGTESIKKVSKITGPGNIYVALAKKAVYGHVSIDSVAGPSEILVLADETATPSYVAADLLSQAEHDELASAILVTCSQELANSVAAEVDRMIPLLERKDIINKSIDNYGFILLADDMETAVDTVNEIAPEHLEILTRDPWAMMPLIRNAGAIFMGEYSSEPLGDYFAGPNHVLPTNGTAKFFSPLCVDDYIKKSSIICYTRSALEKAAPDIVRFARKEGLTAHANSILQRFGDAGDEE